MEADDLDGVGKEAGGCGATDGGCAAGSELAGTEEDQRTVGKWRAGVGGRPLRVGGASDG